ncbi:MAG: cyclase family protein [Gemmataceae bacterium]|nr:cyclase family protein [Gemmataceae bacterium]
MQPWWQPALGKKVYDLEQPRRADMPVHPSHKPGYQYLLHNRHEDNYQPQKGPRSSASGALFMKEHTGTHIDAWSHQADSLHLCGGVKVTHQVETGSGFTYGGVETIPMIVRRGWLFDVPSFRGVKDLPPRDLVNSKELDAIAQARKLKPAKGDVLLVRVGNDQHWNNEARFLESAGMTRDAALWAAELGVFAVGADNMSWEPNGLVDPELGPLPCHLELLARRGIYIIENLKLDELAKDGVTEFLFICLPLKLVGATGSPVRPVALA